MRLLERGIFLFTLCWNLTAGELGTPQEILVKSNEVYLSWVLPEVESFEIFSIPTVLQKNFQSSIQKQTSTDPLFLLKRQRSLFSNFPNAHFNMGLLIEGQVGKIRPMNRLENELFSEHIERFPQNKPSEFQAFTLRKQKGLKIYFISGGFIPPPSEKPILPLLEKDLKNGWEVESHIHNHPFFFENLPIGDIAGTVVPSENDVSYYQEYFKNLRLKKIKVLNGFHTFEASREDLESFKY